MNYKLNYMRIMLKLNLIQIVVKASPIMVKNLEVIGKEKM